MSSQDKMSASSLSQLIRHRMSRRDALKGVAGLTVSCIASSGSASPRTKAVTNPAAVSSHGFQDLPHTYINEPSDVARCATAEVADGHQYNVLLRWGDAVVAGSDPMDVRSPSLHGQTTSFGYNNDFVGYLPLPLGSVNSRHGLLCVNHEYTNRELMFAGLQDEETELPEALEKISDEQMRIEMAAHGHSVVEVSSRETANGIEWECVGESKLNRRITAATEGIRISGPAAGHDRLKTKDDPTGAVVTGTLANCAGGITPWGTVLFAEENFQEYFHGCVSEGTECENHARYQIGADTQYAWHRLAPRFDAELNPNEPNRFGWVVEIDPYDPNSIPVKRTAMGRFRHEGAATSVTPDGRVVVYSGDDDYFEYLYKFVSANPFDPNDREANRDLLDEGTLFVARFDAEGTVHWLPLVHGDGPLTADNGFDSQADVLIETRRAASLLGATPMDRPEDVEENPVTGRVYAMMTTNWKRTDEQTESSNPRADNAHGHVLELVIPRVGNAYDHAATEHPWNVFLLGGDPQEDGGWYGGEHPASWLTRPDNCAFDNRGRLWIATDGGEYAAGFSDGVYVCATEGTDRAVPHLFFHAPNGAEVCGPCFTPDNKTLFVAVQHPGAGSTLASPSTRWPHAPDSDLPPVPAVIAITHQDPRHSVADVTAEPTLRG